MATYSGIFDNNGYTLYLEATEVNISSANNTSVVNWTLKIISTKSLYYGSWDWDGTPYSVSINGEVVDSGSKAYDFRNYQGLTVASGSKTFKHKEDGSGSVDLSAAFGDGNTPIGDATAGGKLTLTKIPRSSTISNVSGTTIGGQMTVTIARAVSTFTHQLWYTVGDGDWYDLGKGIGTSKTFTIDLATANQLPNAMSGTLQLCLRTFDGATAIGSDYYHNVTVSVPSYDPTISNIKLTGNGLLSGEYVQGKSTVTVEITASSLYGADIRNISSVVDGKTYTGSKFTYSALSTGSKSVAVTVTDSRGRTATLTSSAFTVREYSNPTITEFTLERQDDDPEKVIATVKGSIASVNNKNEKTIEVSFNNVPDILPQTITPSGYTIEETFTFTKVSTDNTLTAIVKITDSYTHVTREFVLPTVAVTMDFLYDGKGIAMGKVAETTDLLDVAWNERVRKDLTVDGKINGVSIGTDNYVLGGSKDNITDENWIANAPSFLGTYSQNDQWYSTMSVRHRNGQEDGTNYGLQLRSILTQEDNLSWRQNFGGSWQGWKTLLDSNNTKDYIVEQGTSGIWTYRKWNSGLAECWGVYTMTSAATKAWGALYYSDTLAPRINYPFTFTTRPQESAFLHGSSVAGWVYPEAGGIGLNTTTQTGQYGFLRPTSIASSEVKYEYTVVGRWK